MLLIFQLLYNSISVSCLRSHKAFNIEPLLAGGGSTTSFYQLDGGWICSCCSCQSIRYCEDTNHESKTIRWINHWYNSEGCMHFLFYLSPPLLAQWLTAVCNTFSYCGFWLSSKFPCSTQCSIYTFSTIHVFQCHDYCVLTKIRKNFILLFHYIICWLERRYTGPCDVFIKTLKSEGPLAFLKGTAASWMRLGPVVAISFIVFEQLRRFFGVAPI